MPTFENMVSLDSAKYYVFRSQILSGRHAFFSHTWSVFDLADSPDTTITDFHVERTRPTVWNAQAALDGVRRNVFISLQINSRSRVLDALTSKSADCFNRSFLKFFPSLSSNGVMLTSRRTFSTSKDRLSANDQIAKSEVLRCPWLNFFVAEQNGWTWAQYSTAGNIFMLSEYSVEACRGQSALINVPSAAPRVYFVGYSALIQAMATIPQRLVALTRSHDIFLIPHPRTDEERALVRAWRRFNMTPELYVLQHGPRNGPVKSRPLESNENSSLVKLAPGWEESSLRVQPSHPGAISVYEDNVRQREAVRPRLNDEQLGDMFDDLSAAHDWFCQFSQSARESELFRAAEKVTS